MSKQNTRGFNEDHMHYLAHHAQQFHGPDAFADEVQEHLNNLASPEDDQNVAESHQDQAISNLSEGSPANILAPPKVKPTPSVAPPPSAVGLS